MKWKIKKFKKKYSLPTPISQHKGVGKESEANCGREGIIWRIKFCQYFNRTLTQDEIWWKITSTLNSITSLWNRYQHLFHCVKNVNWNVAVFISPFVVRPILSKELNLNQFRDKLSRCWKIQTKGLKPAKKGETLLIPIPDDLMSTAVVEEITKILNLLYCPKKMDFTELEQN